MALEKLYNLLFGSYSPIQKGLVMLAVVAFIVLLLKDPGKGRMTAQRSLETIANVFVLIAAGITLGSVIQTVVPREVIGRTLGGESGLVGILLATALGAVIPGGPYVLLPVLSSLIAAGADISPVISFIIAWSTIALGRVPFELAFLDSKIVAVRVLIGIPLPIIAGYLTKVVSKFVL